MPPENNFSGAAFAAPGTATAGPASTIKWTRAALMQVGSLAFAVALIGRSAKVQLLERDQWRARASAQQLAATPLPAPRGTILDESGSVLVESRQLVKLSIAPREVVAALGKRADGAARLDGLARTLTRAGVSKEWVARARDTSRAWVEIPGRFLATDVGSVTSMRGVHAEPALERVAPANDGLRRLIGRADDAGGPVDGIEKSLDALLRGEGGRESLVRDARGQRMRSPNVAEDAPTPGHTVVLSINQSLQDIAERSLNEAVTTMGASGGDIVMIDPATGEVRAMASRRSDVLSTAATALTEPYEPGSTLKPFVAARLMDLGRARADEVMPTYNGVWELNGRKIEDDHKGASFSLADVIRFSSNIGIVQFAQRFTHDEQFELLRDIGFGTPTGLPYPVEATGILPSPRKWDSMTPASLAMGYALSVTPMQVAAAYVAIANGGLLLEPAIVKEVRTPDGVVTYTHKRRVLRRVMSEESARAVRGMLRGVMETGTGAGSNLTTFDIAGKTGTAKRTENGKYVPGKYTASFVGMFPADNPQMVILVKLDNPSKSIYGGKAAAPVSKVVLQAALAARDAALDRRTLAEAPRSEPKLNTPVKGTAKAVAGAPGPATTTALSSQPTVVETALVAAPEVAPSAGTVPFVVRIDQAREEADIVVARRAVPNVKGMAVRRAVYELHRAGFRASLGAGASAGDHAGVTWPAAGTVLVTGSRVVLERAP